MTTSMGSPVTMHRGGARIRGGFTATVSSEQLLVAVIALVWLTTLFVDFRVALTLLMATGFSVAAIGLRYPRFGLLGIGMLCTLNEIAAPLLLSGGLWRWNSLSYWLLLVALLFMPYLRLRQLQSQVLLAFVLLVGLEILLSPDPQNGVEHVFGILAVFGLLVYFSRGAVDLKSWYWLGVVNGVLAGGGSAALLLQRDRLPYVNPNVWSYLPATAILSICLAFFTTRGAPRRWFWLAVLAAINAVWVFLSGSRGSLLVVVVCLAFLIAMM